MTDTGGGAADESTRIDREPPAFPSVGADQRADSDARPSPAAPPPLFRPAGSGDGADVSPVVSRQLDRPPRNSGGRLRWLVAGLATILVFVIVGGALFLAAPRTGSPSASAHYAPAGTTMYTEVRLDLPGDQHDNLASFMSHFPGFADQATFQQKFDESINTLLAKKSSDISWTNDIKPWFGGQLAVFGDPYNPAIATDAHDSMPAASPGVVVMTVTDKAKLQALIDAHVGTATVTSTDYNGTTIKTMSTSDSMVGESYAITDDAVLVASDIAQIKKALDTKGGQNSALADDAYFIQQIGSLHADRLATIYFNGANMTTQMPGGMNLGAQCAAIQSGIKVKYVGEVRAEGDHIAFTLRSQVPSGTDAPPAPQNGNSTLAEAMPADTTVYFETRNLGAGLGWLIKQGVACFESMPASSPAPTTISGLGDMTGMFEQFLGAKPEDYFDFVQDAAVGVSYAGDKVNGGLVATVDDQAVATQRVDKLVSLIKLFGSGMGGGFGSGSSSSMQVTTDELDHNGTKVTVVHVDSGTGSDPMTIQIAVANGRLYLGVNDFVVGALDRQAGDSLASNARYQKATALAPGDNSGVVLVDRAGALDILTRQMPADERAQFESNAMPFVDPLSSFWMVSHVDGATVVSNGFLFVE